MNLLATWFERVNQKFTDTKDGSRPPSYDELWTDVQEGLCAAGHALNATEAQTPDRPSEPIDPLEEGDIPELWQQGWDDCLSTLQEIGIDAKTAITDHTRSVLQRTFDDWKKKRAQEGKA